jgi:hypothetical protein
MKITWPWRKPRTRSHGLGQRAFTWKKIEDTTDGNAIYQIASKTKRCEIIVPVEFQSALFFNWTKAD